MIFGVPDIELNLALKALFKCNKGKVWKHLMQKKLNVAWWLKNDDQLSEKFCPFLIPPSFFKPSFMQTVGVKNSLLRVRSL